MNHWPYWAAESKYTAIVFITLPHNRQTFTINAKDAFVLYLYATYKSLGFDPIFIPKWIAYAALQSKPIDYSKAYSIRDKKLTTKEQINEMLAYTPSFGTIESTAEFYESCVSIRKSRLMQYYYYSNEMYAHTRAELKAISYVPYEDKLITLTTIPTFSEWLDTYQIGVNEYTQDQYKTLAENIIYSALGMENLTNVSILKVQSAMIDLLTKVSSYSIQVVKDANSSKIQLMPRAKVRVAVIQTQHNSNQSVRVGNIKVIDTHTRHLSRFKINLSQLNISSKTTHYSNTDVRVGLRFFNAKNVSDTTSVFIKNPKIRVKSNDAYNHILKNMTKAQILDLPMD
jgi:hypothetical protein